MASKQKEKIVKKTDSKTSFWNKIKSETKQGIIAVTFFVLFLIFILSPFGKAGMVGNQIYSLLSILLGIGYYLIPLFFLMLSISFFKAEEKEFNKLKVIGGLLFFVSGLGLIDLISKTYWTAQGGKLGWLISTPLLHLFGFYASAIILLAIAVIACLIVFETRLTIQSILFWRKWQKKNNLETVDNVKIAGIKEEEKSEEAKNINEEKKEKKTKNLFGKKGVGKAESFKKTGHKHKLCSSSAFSP